MWKAKIDDWDLFDTAKRETCRFIIGSVEYVWLAELKKKITIYAERTALELIEHLYKTCLDTHEIDVLDLQDQMREMHLKVDSIPEYIERMEKFQEQSERADNKIPDAMMVNISTKAVLSTERSPKTNNDWEDLSKTERTWPEWKTMYRDADNKVKVKKKACGDQFGGLANKTALTAQANGESAPKKEPVALEELEGWFDSLATAAVTGKDSIESLLNNNTLLTKTNAKLSAVIKAQAAEIKSLTAGDGGIRNRGTGGAGGDGTKSDKLPRLAKWCPHCKKDTWHDPDDCFELAKNEQ